jgi:signal transduction histidine kinase
VLQRHFTKQKDEQALLYLVRMDEQINRLTKLINDLLDISKMQTGKLVFQEELFDMDVLVRETVETLQAVTQTHRLVIEQTESALVYGDKDRIGQVLINLLTNAVKYSYQSDTVIIRVSKDQKYVMVSVQDFGIGIAEAHQQKIFERFYQVSEPEARPFAGLGIGLHISSEIIKRHAGSLWVESTKGEGSTFRFILPLQSGNETLEPPS